MQGDLFGARDGGAFPSVELTDEALDMFFHDFQQ